MKEESGFRADCSMSDNRYYEVEKERTTSRSRMRENLVLSVS